jgi:gliding motility-associated lipoprotein GldH
MKKHALFLVLAIFIFSCKNDTLYEKYHAIEDSTWDKDNILRYEVQVKDTLASNDIYIETRHLGNYPLSNLYLFITTTAPTGRHIVDTIEIFLADNKGKWYGKGFGDIYSHTLPYKRNVRFPYTGIYTFEIQHGMRIEKLPGIEDIGLRIEQMEINRGEK